MCIRDSPDTADFTAFNQAIGGAAAYAQQLLKVGYRQNVGGGQKVLLLHVYCLLSQSHKKELSIYFSTYFFVPQSVNWPKAV